MGKEEVPHLETLPKRQSKAYGTKMFISGTCCNIPTMEKHFLKTVNSEHLDPLGILVSLTAGCSFSINTDYFTFCVSPVSYAVLTI